MRNKTRWTIAAVLLVLVMSGCTLLPTATPIPAVEPAPTSPAVATDSAPGATDPAATAVPAPTQVSTEPTSAPNPTAPSEPAVIERWQLSDLPTPGRGPVGMVELDGVLMVANADTANVTFVRDNRVIDVVAIEPTSPIDWLYVTSAASSALWERLYIAYSTNESAGIYAMDVTGAAEDWPMPEQISDMSPCGDRLAAAILASGTILMVDPATGQVDDEVQLADGLMVDKLVGDPDGPRLYVYTGWGSEKLIGIEADTGWEFAEISVPGGVRDMALSPDGRQLYVACDEGSALLALDAGTLQELARVALLITPKDLAVSSMTGHVAIAGERDDDVIVLDQDLGEVWELPIGPVTCLIYGDLDVLYVADEDACAVTIHNPVLSSMPPVVPLCAQYGGLAVDPINGRVLVSLQNQDQVLVLGNDGAEKNRWFTGASPEALAVWPGRGTVAVVERGDDKVALFAQDGQVAARYDLAENARGALVDPAGQRLIAGNTLIDAQTSTTRGLTVTNFYSEAATPSKSVLDTRRQRLYGLVDNGIPGSNGGTIIRLMDAPADSTGPDQIGWRSVIDAIYDEEHDQFLVPWNHMGTYGLAVIEAETGRTVHNLSMGDNYATAMALNPASRHLWVATIASLGLDDGPAYTLFGYDTRTMARFQEIDLGVRIDLMAADPTSMRIYMASEDAGALFVLQDMVDRLAAPPKGPATATPLPTQGPIPTLPPPPTVTPAATPCGTQAHPVLALVASLDGVGCPLNEGATTNLAIQPFERGRMIWREDTGEVVVLLDTGILIRIEDSWQEGMPNQACDIGAAPEELWQPIRGFGKVWCEVPDLSEDIGWATQPEAPRTGIAQRFTVGELLHLDGGETLFLSNQGAWRTIGQ